MTIPTLYALIMLLLLSCYIGTWKAIKKTYRRNRRLLYAKSCTTRSVVTYRTETLDYAQMKELIKNKEVDMKIIIEEKEVTLGDVEMAKKHRQ